MWWFWPNFKCNMLITQWQVNNVILWIKRNEFLPIMLKCMFKILTCPVSQILTKIHTKYQMCSALIIHGMSTQIDLVLYHFMRNGFYLWHSCRVKFTGTQPIQNRLSAFMIQYKVIWQVHWTWRGWVDISMKTSLVIVRVKINTILLKCQHVSFLLYYLSAFLI